MKHVSSYIVVFCGARDHYQVAVALAEAGRLQRLVTDFYLPAAPTWLRGLVSLSSRAKRGERRRRADLPKESVRLCWESMLLISVYHALWWPWILRWSDRRLGICCRQEALRSRAHVLAYSYYAFHAFASLPDGVRKVLFQVHPHPDAIRRILTEELERCPEARRSLLAEHEMNASAADLARLSDESRRADFVITPSTFAKRTLVAGGVRESRIRVVPYGIDPTVFRPKASFDTDAERPLRLIFIGSLVQRKGLSYLLEAVRQLGPAVELVLVGRGSVRDDALLATYTDVPFRLVWNAPQDELVQELHRADLFVFPSLAESFAHVILEAMSVGLPVITTTHTAGPDLIEEGKTGFVGAVRDVRFLVEKTQLFLKDRNLIRTMGVAAQQAAAGRTWGKFRQGIRDALAEAEITDR